MFHKFTSGRDHKEWLLQPQWHTKIRDTPVSFLRKIGLALISCFHGRNSGIFLSCMLDSQRLIWCLRGAIPFLAMDSSKQSNVTAQEPPKCLSHPSGFLMADRLKQRGPP